MQDNEWMRFACFLASKAEDVGEVPVGACVVLDNRCIGLGFNQPIYNQDPCAHAEIIALRNAAKNINNYRLNKAVIYVSLEPCLMCFGAMLHARISKLVFAASDLKKGVISNNKHKDLFAMANHSFTINNNVESQLAENILINFFNKRRG